MNYLVTKRTLLFTSIAGILGGMSSGVFAQAGSEVVEEIMVTGIRGSLVQSMDVKRNSSGVVDAISAEDIGKMPDTNLAESLQRITGVSIDRNNGEGSRVTVRGFGSDFNVITLNGRQMPAASLEATSASNSRSFLFDNLAAESVAGVDIHKTGKANLSTGGIGALINIKTAKPLNMPGLTASVGVKAVNDTSNRTGSDVTPEVSGIFSQTFADDTFGVAVTGSYQARDSGYNSAETSSGWYTIKGTQGDWGSLPENGSFENRPQENDVYSVPRNLMYSVNDVERERTNGQVTFQWAPIESVTATLDYTYYKMDTEQHRQELSVWFNGNPASGIYTEGTNQTGSVVGPVVYSDSSGADIGMGVGSWGIINEGNSVGLNLEWRPTDNLTVALDYHNSDAEAAAKDHRGTNNIVTAVHYNRTSASVDYSEDFPVLAIVYTDGQGLNPEAFQSSGTSFRNSYMLTEIEQTKLDAKYEFDNSFVKSIEMGLSLTDNQNRSAFSNAQRDTWGGYGGAEDFADDLFERKNLGSEFDSISGSNNPNLEPYYYAVDFDGFSQAVGAVAVKYGDTSSQLYHCGAAPQLCANPEFSADRRALEEQTAAYLQTNMSWEWASMPVNLGLGVRYEETDITAKALVPNYTSLVWASDNEFTPIASGSTFTQLPGAYNNWLPNIDLDIELTEELVARASYSVTIARPSYGDIQGGQTINQPIRFNGGTGQSGNPDLDPFESTNLDLSTEWYYADDSYISLGYYRKDVENFIGNDSYQSTIFNLAHPAQGPRYDEAVAAVGSSDPALVLAYMREQSGGGAVVGSAVLGDPVTTFTMIAPYNQKEATIDGFEFAVQHLFGDSGFGSIFNITTVNGDISYDNYNTNKGEGVVNQFALLGLSDSANLIGFYEKDSFQARIAYNWRDDFLVSTFDGNGERNPIYVEAFGQVDVNISYELNEHLSFFAEGINILDENTRTHGRHQNMVVAAVQTGARYNIGARYKF